MDIEFVKLCILQKISLYVHVYQSGIDDHRNELRGPTNFGSLYIALGDTKIILILLINT